MDFGPDREGTGSFARRISCARMTKETEAMCTGASFPSFGIFFRHIQAGPTRGSAYTRLASVYERLTLATQLGGRHLLQVPDWPRVEILNIVSFLQLRNGL